MIDENLSKVYIRLTIIVIEQKIIQLCAQMWRVIRFNDPSILRHCNFQHLQSRRMTIVLLTAFNYRFN